jgi:hypothetical protein
LRVSIDAVGWRTEGALEIAPTGIACIHRRCGLTHRGRSGDRPYKDCAYPSTQGPGFAIILLITLYFLLFTFYFLLFTFYLRAPRGVRGWATKKPGGGPGFIYEGVVFTF